MRIRGFLLVALLGALGVPAAASADTTLGTVTAPTGTTTTTACTSAYTGQILVSSLPTENPSGPYVVPSSSPQALTQWSINATGATAGAQAELVVLSINDAEGDLTVVGTDTETLSTTGLPADGVETFTLTSPIQVQAGDIIGVYFPGSAAPGVTCDWSDSSIQEDTSGFVLTGPPTIGETITPGIGNAGATDENSLLNLGATLATPSYDAGLSLSSGPSGAMVGQPAVLSATITNHGPFAGPVTFTDPVPSGLTVESVSVGSGSCSVSAGVNIVTCTTGSLSAGQSTQAVIVVKPTAAQSYPDSATVSVSVGATDPNSANNTASTTLVVSNVPATPKCVVPKLGGASLALVKQVLPLLDCKLGKVKKATSKSVAKGDVISTSPGTGSYAAGKSIAVTESSGKPKPKPKPKKKKKK
jgi:uncharacterized repeat protein (TIGR01451 family)